MAPVSWDDTTRMVAAVARRCGECNVCLESFYELVKDRDLHATFFFIYRAGSSPSSRSYACETRPGMTLEHDWKVYIAAHPSKGSQINTAIE